MSDDQAVVPPNMSHMCYPGSPGSGRLDDDSILERHQSHGEWAWRVVIRPRGFFAGLAKPGWYFVRFCPWCGERLPQYPEAPKREGLE